MTIWEKYSKITELGSNNQNCKNYLSVLKVIIKEIIPKDNNEYSSIKNKLEYIKHSNFFKIYDIIEELGKIYIVIDDNNQDLEKFNLILNRHNEEGNVLNKELPISKKEINNLFKMETAICRIYFQDKNLNPGKGTGFFCQLNEQSIPMKYALFTNNHVLNKSNIEKYIKMDIIAKSYESNVNKYIDKEIKVKNRKIITNEDLDYTCIELYEKDGITNFFKIDTSLNNDKSIFLNKEIFILQYPLDEDISF